MPSSRGSRPLTPEELAQAVAYVAECLSRSGARFSISGGAAASVIRRQYSLQQRTTDDIALVVQPRGNVTAESISAWLVENFPTAFVGQTPYGVTTPALAFQRSDGSIKNVEIEIFDFHAWPQRPQYNLDDPDNDITVVPVSGVDVPVFSARWLLREKIITAYERRGSRKERTDLDDACILLRAVDDNCLDLTDREEEVKHIVTHRPRYAQRLALKIVCQNVFGNPWTRNESAGVRWRFEGHELRYLDSDLQRHRFKWDSNGQVWYLVDQTGSAWFYSEEIGDLALWT